MAMSSWRYHSFLLVWLKEPDQQKTMITPWCCCLPHQIVEQTVGLPLIWDTLTLMRHQCIENKCFAQSFFRYNRFWMTLILIWQHQWNVHRIIVGIIYVVVTMWKLYHYTQPTMPGFLRKFVFRIIIMEVDVRFNHAWGSQYGLFLDNDIVFGNTISYGKIIIVKREIHLNYICAYCS